MIALALAACTLGTPTGHHGPWTYCERPQLVCVPSEGREPPRCHVYREEYRERTRGPYDLQIRDRGRWVTVVDQGEIAP